MYLNFFSGLKAKDIDNMDIMNWCVEFFDSAGNTSGIQYSGLQARIETINRLADFVPYAGHFFKFSRHLCS